MTWTPALLAFFFTAPYFVEFLSMKHVCCCLHNGAICMLHHYVLLEPTLSECLLLNTMLEFS